MQTMQSIVSSPDVTGGLFCHVLVRCQKSIKLSLLAYSTFLRGRFIDGFWHIFFPFTRGGYFNVRVLFISPRRKITNGSHKTSKRNQKKGGATILSKMWANSSGGWMDGLFYFVVVGEKWGHKS